MGIVEGTHALDTVMYSYFFIMPFIPIYRYHILRNGSLLITKARTTDSGRYKCNVTNQFSSNKTLRNSLTSLVVMSRNGNDDDSYEDDNEEALLSKLQHSMYKIESGGMLELFCVSNWRGEKVRKIY